MILRRAISAVLAISCLALAACSSSDGSGQSDPPTGSPSSTNSTSSSVSSPTGTATPSASSSSGSATGSAGLAAIVVQRGDVPTTFQAGKPDTSSDDSDNDVLPCIGAKSTKSDEQATVHSQDFSTETSSISSQVTRFGSQSSVDSDAKIFRSPKIQSCLSALLTKKAAGIGSGATIVSTKVEVTPGADGGPSNVVSKTTATIVAEKDGKQLPIIVDSVYITGPKIEVEMDFTSFGTRFDPALAKTVTSAVAKRAAAA